jgi:hypothetical protein
MGRAGPGPSPKAMVCFGALDIVQIEALPELLEATSSVLEARSRGGGELHASAPASGRGGLGGHGPSRGEAVEHGRRPDVAPRAGGTWPV